MFRKSLMLLAVLGSAALFAGAASAQVVVYDPAVAPAAVYSPVVPTYSPVLTAPPAVIYRSPVVRYSPIVAPVVAAYTPVVRAYSPVVVGRPVLVRTKVYVAGQPVRNFFRAITP